MVPGKKKETAARKNVSEILIYYNQVRLYFDPNWKDYTKRNLSDKDHAVWLNNSIGQKDNTIFRAFQAWSYVERGKEELQMVKDDIDGVFRWLQLESERAMRLYREASSESEQSYRIQRIHNIERRCSDWTLRLTSLRSETVQALRTHHPQTAH